jgi:tRNA pseudouridine55 synthase
LPSGLVLIDKPINWTSHDVVAKVRKALGTKKVGHAGTLDPLATGLLVLGIGAGTKLLTYLVGSDKSYQATVRLGQATISDDSQSEVVFSAPPEKLAAISKEQILAGIKKLTGPISQRPSSVSAIKVAGKRAYDLVRAGEEVNLATREVLVERLDLISEPELTEAGLDIKLAVDCSSGTYVRALARDLGEDLGVGGHITQLRRTRVGGHLVDSANTVLELDSLRLLPLSQAAAALFPTLELSPQQEQDLIHGKRLVNSLSHSGRLAGISSTGRLVAVLEARENELRSLVVFQGVEND